MIQKALKIGVFSLLFSLVAGCGNTVSDYHQRDQILHKNLNTIISFVSSAFRLENTEFQGILSGEALFGSQSTSFDFSGSLAFLSGDFGGKLSFFVEQNQKTSTFSQALSGQLLLRKSGLEYYFYPEALNFIGGEGNIQLKFLQLMLQGIVGNWLQIENSFLSQESWFVGIPELPQLFSGEHILTDNLQNYSARLLPSLEFLTGSLERNENTDWIFKDWKGTYRGQPFDFSGSFDGKYLLGNFQLGDQLPWEFELNFEDDQLFLLFSRGATTLNLQLKKLKNSDFSLLIQIGNLEKKGKNFLLQSRFSRNKANSPLQTPPNNYIPLVQYLDSLNIGF